MQLSWAFLQKQIEQKNVVMNARRERTESIEFQDLRGKRTIGFVAEG
jgi:hypothetical protein